MRVRVLVCACAYVCVQVFVCASVCLSVGLSVYLVRAFFISMLDQNLFDHIGGTLYL